MKKIFSIFLLLYGALLLGVGAYKAFHPVQYWAEAGKPLHPVLFGYVPIGGMLVLLAVLSHIEYRKYSR